MDVAALAWLRSAEGRRVLAELATLHSLDDATALREGTRLRKRLPPDLAAAAMTQARLRQRARQKFGTMAARLWFTPAGLQQATHPAVAAHRAARMQAAGASTMTDLCCGIGSDLLAFAAAGLEVIGVDADPVTAAVAAANVTEAGLAASVEAADATARPVSGPVFVDPARRGDRGRVFDVRSYTPPWSFVRDLLDGSAGPPMAAAKVAPGIPHEILPPGVGAEWVSLDGEVKETGLYSAGCLAALADPFRRRATLLPGGHTLSACDADTEQAAAPVGEIGRWLYEPDGAVIRAHLVGAVVEAVDGRLVDPMIAYVSADRLRVTPFANAYEVLEVLPFDIRRLRGALRARGVGSLTIKKRGVDVVPDQLRRQLLRGLTGAAPATVVLTRRAQGATAMLVRPVVSA